MLFATLDPTTRRVRLGEGQTVIVSDTVGFIHKLPHQLVDAFRATLEEVTRADALLEVVDLADRHAAEHRRTVQTVLDELGAGHKPRVVVLNKVDLAGCRWVQGRRPAGCSRRDDQHVVRASALTGEGIEGLREHAGDRAGRSVAAGRSRVPYSAGNFWPGSGSEARWTFEYRDEDVRVAGQRAAVAWPASYTGRPKPGSAPGGADGADGRA